jgi:two-component system sensor kinase FixL
MSWVTVLWPMIASACLTLAAMHVLIWADKRTAWASLLFSLTAVATAAVTGFELWLMRAETAQEYGEILRWAHVPYWALILSLVGFVRVYLRAGRLWLAYAVCGVRTLSLVLDFVFSPNLNFREITALRHVSFLGDSVAVAQGISNPWMLIGQASFLLLAVYVLDVMRTVSRRGDRRQARVLTGAIVFFVLAATGQIVLVMWQIIHTPLTPSLFFLGIVAAMAYEMSADVRRAAQLSDDLRESEERITLATEAGGVGMWMWSIASDRVWASARWRSLFGFVPDSDVSFGNVIQHIHPDDREGVQRDVRRAVEDRGDYAGEYRVVRPDGTERWLAARGRTYSDAHGKPVRMVGAAIDITARNQADTEATLQRNELAHLSRVLTLSELSGSLAHELNQPLAIILTNAQAAQRLLAQQPPDLAEARDILADIVSEDQRAGEVIARLRSLLKSGRTEVQPVAVNELIEDVLRIARSDLIGRAVSVHLGLAPNVPAVLGDRIQLQQVLLNLILNACDAMSANPPARRYLTLATKHHDGVVRMSVSDTGCGLPPEADRVFEPFYSTKAHGLGLGLSICRSIVTAHKGRLWAEAGGATDAPDAVAPASGGATLHLELPVADGEAP